MSKRQLILISDCGTIDKYAAEDIVAVIPKCWSGFFKRATTFIPGRRYTITWTHGDDPDWTVLDMGKVENRK